MEQSPQHFEVKIEKAQNSSIKIGFFYYYDDKDMKKVTGSCAASQHKNGWLYNCKNGNLVNNSQGNEWNQLTEAQTSPKTVGMLMSVSPPARARA